MPHPRDSASPDLVEAVLEWTGYGRTTWPTRDDARVIQRFGHEAAATLLPAMRMLETEFYSSDACHRAADLPEMWRLSMEDFRKRHPEIPTKIVEAFAWSYTFDYK